MSFDLPLDANTTTSTTTSGAAPPSQITIGDQKVNQNSHQIIVTDCHINLLNFPRTCVWSNLTQASKKSSVKIANTSEACVISIQGRLIYLGNDHAAETYRLIFESLTYPCLNCTCLLIIRDPTLLLLQELGLCRIKRWFFLPRDYTVGVSNFRVERQHGKILSNARRIDCGCSRGKNGQN